MASSPLRFPVPHAIAATTVTASLILVGSALTQSLISAPALLVDFPALGHPEHARRATLLGHQWPRLWVVGNNILYPASAVGVLGYGFAAWAARRGAVKGDWRVFVLGTVCHVGNVLYSMVWMQPLNDRIDALRRAADKTNAVQMARDWVRANRWRVVFPLVAGMATVVQAFLV